jgi:hypothetical protein
MKPRPQDWSEAEMSRLKDMTRRKAGTPRDCSRAWSARRIGEEESARVRIGAPQKMTMKPPNSRQRQIMQYLRGAGWVKAAGMPDSPKIIADLIEKGWLEVQQTEGGHAYRLTEPGLQAMKAPLPVRPLKPSAFWSSSGLRAKK